MGIYGHLETSSSDAAGSRRRAYIRPSAILNRVMNPITVALGRRTVLVVRGRKSGKLLKIPMDPPFAWMGTRYLVSPRGETHWARNLRVAHEADLRSHGGLEHIRVVELQGEEHDKIVRAYASMITCNCRKSMELLPGPADHPVFRIDPTAT